MKLRICHARASLVPLLIGMCLTQARAADILSIDEIQRIVSKRIAHVKSFSFEWEGLATITAGGHNAFAPKVLGEGNTSLFEGRNFPPDDRKLSDSGSLIASGDSLWIHEVEDFYNLMDDSITSSDTTSSIRAGVSRRLVLKVGGGGPPVGLIDKAPPSSYPGIHRTPFMPWLSLSTAWLMRDSVVVVRHEVSKSGGALIVLGEAPEPGPTGNVAAIEVWVDPQFECLPVLVRVGVSPTNGRAEMEVRQSYVKEPSGLMVPASVELQLFVAGVCKERAAIAVKNLRINPTVDDNIYANPFPPGTSVRDALTLSEEEYVRLRNENPGVPPPSSR